MTIIWAKQIQGKRNLFSDDCISLWDYQTSWSGNYRKKLRKIPRAPREMYVASSWTCRQTDLVINNIDKALSKVPDCMDAYDIKDILQEAIIDVIKVLKEIDEDNPNFILLILDTELNVMYLIETFAVNILEPNVEYAWWSWDITFYTIHKIPSMVDSDDKYIADFRLAAKDAPWCWWNIYQVSADWEKIYDELK